MTCGCAWVTADAARMASSDWWRMASGAMRMRLPLPCERSPVEPRPERMAVAQVRPQSNTSPSGV